MRELNVSEINEVNGGIAFTTFVVAVVAIDLGITGAMFVVKWAMSKK